MPINRAHRWLRTFPDMQANARELVRRGTTDQMFNASRVVQNSGLGPVDGRRL